MDESRETKASSSEVKESPTGILAADPSWEGTAAQPPVPDDNVETNSSGGDDDDDDDSDFEFVVVGRGADGGLADEIFSNGQILPVYPVFGRCLLDAGDAAKADGIHIPLKKLLIEEREGPSDAISPEDSAASPAAEKELPEADGNSCIWEPPARCQKSASTGSSRRWRLRDLMVGRSHSDGKEKFVFLSPNPYGDRNGGRAQEKKGKGKEKEKKKKKNKEATSTEMDMVTAHRRLYENGAGRGAAANGGKRLTYLPYRRDLVGFFANVNGFSRTHHPF